MKYWFDVEFPDDFESRQLSRIFTFSNLRDQVSRTKLLSTLCLPLPVYVNGQINAWGELNQVGLIEEPEVLWDCQVQCVKVED
jgi:hypothetical protein